MTREIGGPEYAATESSLEVKDSQRVRVLRLMPDGITTAKPQKRLIRNDDQVGNETRYKIKWLPDFREEWPQQNWSDRDFYIGENPEENPKGFYAICFNTSPAAGALNQWAERQKKTKFAFGYSIYGDVFIVPITRRQIPSRNAELRYQNWTAGQFRMNDPQGGEELLDKLLFQQWYNPNADHPEMST